MNTAPALSASQLKSFLACPRKWAFDKIDRVPRPDTPSTALGTRVHEILEDWLRDGTPPDLNEVYSYENPKRPGEQVVRHPGRIAHAGLHLLPAPRTPGLEIEGWLSLRTRATVWSGRLDLRYIDPHTGEAVVHDHKTTSSAAYALTPETLRTDPQALLYAASEMVRLGVPKVRLDWLYLPTAGGKAWKVSLPVLRDEIAPDLDRLEDTAALMQRTLASGLTARDIPGNPRACNDYGGCEYLLICDRTTLPTTSLFQGFDDMTHPTSPDALSAMDALMAKLNGGAPLPPPPPVDVINPPEAPPPTIAAPPPVAPPPPPVVVVPPAGYATMERKDLKTLAVARGLLEESSKLGKAAIVALLEGQDGGPVAPPPIRGLPIEYAQTAVVIPPPPVPEPPSAADLAGPPPAPIAQPAPPPAPTVVNVVNEAPPAQVAPAAPPPAPTLAPAHRAFWSDALSAMDALMAKLNGGAPLPPPPPVDVINPPEAPPVNPAPPPPVAPPPPPAPTLTPAHRAFWSEAYLAAARNGHATPVSVADAALKSMIVRFGGIT